MRKLVNILFVFFIVFESFFIVNLIYKENKIEKNEISKMKFQMAQIKENVNAVIENKCPVDVEYISEQCLLFLDGLEEYKFKYDNADIEKIVELVSEYKNLILEIKKTGYNEKYDKRLYKIKKALDVIEIEKGNSFIEFDENLKRFNERIESR